MYRTRTAIIVCLGLALLLSSPLPTSTPDTVLTTAPPAVNTVEIDPELVAHRPRYVRPPPAPGPTFNGRYTGTVNGYPCGGDLPPCRVLKRESGGDPKVFYGFCYRPCKRIRGKLQTASGLWQVVVRTWGGYGGYRYAADAPPEVQNEFAARLWNKGRGCRHWAACRGR